MKFALFLAQIHNNNNPQLVEDTTHNAIAIMWQQMVSISKRVLQWILKACFISQSTQFPQTSPVAALPVSSVSD